MTKDGNGLNMENVPEGRAGQYKRRNMPEWVEEELSTRLKYATQLLDQDARPSFIVDVTRCHNEEPLCVTYTNSAFDIHTSLRHVILDRDLDPVGRANFVAFQQWMSTRHDSVSSSVETHRFHGLVWSPVPLARYLIISGIPEELVVRPNKDAIRLQDNTSHVVDSDMIQRSVRDQLGLNHLNHGRGINQFDFGAHSADQVPGTMSRTPRTPHMQHFYDIDWASTSLGAMETWSDELQQMCTFVMADTEPALLFWGEEFLVLHNEAAIQFFPQMSNSFMGNTVKKSLPLIWDSFAVAFDTVRKTKQIVLMNDLPVLLDRHGQLSECFISYRYIPVEDKFGNCLGVYSTVREVTAEVLSRRRLATLLQVSSCSNQVTEKKVFWNRLLGALSPNKEDIGFALLYSFQTLEPDLANITSRRICTLEGTLGITQEHLSVRKTIDIDAESGGYIPGIRLALEDNAPVLLNTKDGSLPQEYVVGVHCQGYSSPCDGVLVCPIRPTDGAGIEGFLIIGLSSRIVYDFEFRQFIEILNRQIATSMASIALFNGEVERERKRAEETVLVHAQLQARLEQKTRDMMMSEARFERMTDIAPVGICIMDSATGLVTYANEAWYRVTHHPGPSSEPLTTASWIALLHDEDVEKGVSYFNQLASDRKQVTFDIRMKKELVKEMEGAEPITMPSWLLVTAYSLEEDENGRPKSVFGTLTDISAQKWAEETHRRRMLEALELKSQQESFIDTISHEMRNPLSAILQSVDDIAEYLSETKSNSSIDPSSIKNSTEAIETIMLCCQHQRRVIDDVLTLSKMNTDMLAITVDETDPLETVRSVVRMFSGDAKKQGISLEVEVEDSVKRMGVSRLQFDPSRLSQVLVNLLGNAIKFTRESPERRIKVTIGTSISRPSDGDHGVNYVARSSETSSGSNVRNSTEDERIFLRIAVQDTGVGMSDEEKNRLFRRFAQASPRTHVKYGGSGLGLFISKKLAELQGGAIGLKMGDDQGTTFAFYISTLRSGGESSTADIAETIPDFDVLVQESVMSHNKSPAPAAREESVDIEMSLTQATTHTLLVVEDNLINQRVTCRQLRKLGYVVYAASNGVEALEVVGKSNLYQGQEETGTPLSLILLDIEMPIMDGLTCVRKIRQLEAEGVLSAHIPVISVSANARREQVRDAKIAGMDDNIPKPFRVVDLVPLMEEVMERCKSSATAAV